MNEEFKEMKTLTSLTDYSDYIDASVASDAEKWQLHRKRVLLGKRQPQLSDFVACGKDGLPIEKPSEHLENRSLYYQELEAYQKALDKVLFKDCAAEKINDYYVVKHQDKTIWVSWNTFHKIESLTPYNLELTDNANKLIKF